MASQGSDLVVMPERVPWSQMADGFTQAWGRPRGKVMPEHLELVGLTGSGKTTILRQMLFDRTRRRGSSVVVIATKPDDKSVFDFGWPITDTWRGVEREEQVVFWPRTRKLGAERKAFQHGRIMELLDHLWQPEANRILVVDEWSWVEGLSADMRSTLQMYLREGRALGITCVMGRQRVQGTQRDMHSESDWKVAFPMNDADDQERLAQLFGPKRDFVPILDSLNREKFEFLIQHKLTKETYISWVDKPQRARQQKTGYRS